VTKSLSEAVSAALLDVGDAGRDAVPPVRVPLAGATVTDDDPVRRAVARCGVCPWTAIMRGDTDAEITEFLRLLLADHLTTLHPRRRRHE
jgi:hypothetical protein